jgi:hypothetical protein
MSCITMAGPPQTSLSEKTAKAFQITKPTWTQSKDSTVNEDSLLNTQLDTVCESITFSTLPLEILTRIFFFCTPINLYGKIRRVCRRFNTVALLLLHNEFFLNSRINLQSLPFSCEIVKRKLVPWPNFIHCEPNDSAEDPKLFIWTGDVEYLAPVWDRIDEGNKIVYFVTSPPWHSQYLFKSHYKAQKSKSIWSPLYFIRRTHQSNSRDTHTFICDGKINWKIVYSRIPSKEGPKPRYVVDIMLPLKGLLDA